MRRFLLEWDEIAGGFRLVGEARGEVIAEIVCAHVFGNAKILEEHERKTV
jgi:hypothetical protein